MGAEPMPRTVRDTNLETRAARERLAVRHQPYWRAIDRGYHLGYRKGKRGGKWLGRFRPNGERYLKKVLGRADDVLDADGVAVLSFTQAQAKAREWFAEQAARAAGISPTGSTVADAMRDYLAWYAVHRKALMPTTKAAETHILPSLGDIELSKLTSARMRQWHEDLAAAPARLRSGRGKPISYRPAPSDADGFRRRRATANRVLTVLKAALNHAWHEDKVASDEAWRRVKPFRNAEAARVRYLTTDESTRLINACESDFRELVQAALLTGCRYGELTAMQCGDFNAATGTVSVGNSKSGKPRHVPLNDEGVTFFEGVTAGRPGDKTMFLRADGKLWGMSHQRRRLEDAAKAATVTDVSFHILRHSYGSALAMQGVPMGVIAAALGHADTRMTERHYAALAPSYVADTIRANLPKLGIVAPDNVTPLRQHR